MSRAIMAIGVVIALDALEINVGPLLAVIGAAGFVVAFSLQGTLDLRQQEADRAQQNSCAGPG